MYKIKLKIYFLLIMFVFLFKEIYNLYITYINSIYSISVIVPIYNREKYIKSSLNCILNQTLKDIEIICINDGSTDNSLKIIQNYAKIDKRLIIINQKNKGAGIARNKGIKLSKGKYISFIDSDDLYPNKYTLELMYNKAIKNNIFICGGGLKVFKEENNIIKLFKYKEKKMTFNKEGIINYFDYQYNYGFSRFIYNKKFLIKNKLFFPNYYSYEDPPFFIKTMIKARQFYALKEDTYLYRTYYKEKIIWNERKIGDPFNGIKDSFLYSEKYKLNILYCHIYENLNSKLFFTPLLASQKYEKTFNKFVKLLKILNYTKLKECTKSKNILLHLFIKIPEN